MEAIILFFATLGLSGAGPQYGGGSSGVASVPAPSPQVASPTCWTEQETVWDTKYVDQVTQECRPVTQQVCNDVTKQVPQRVSKSVPKKVCDDGGNYGAQSSPQSQGSFGGSSGGYNGGNSGSFSGQSQGGYSGGSSSQGSFSEPRGSQGNGNLRVRTGSNPDAVNFGK